MIAARNVRVAHLSDIHIGDAETSLLANGVQAVNQARPDVIVLSGDITQSGRKREYEQAAHFLALFEAPIVATPGNHDAPVFNPIARLMAPYARFGRLAIAPYWRDVGAMAAIETISTARAIQARRDWSQGAFNLEDVRRAICHSGGARWRLLAAHHPPGTLPGAKVRSQARRADKAAALFSKVDRTLLLCGHSHGFQIERTRGTASGVIVAPSFASGRHRGGGHGFNVIDLSPTAARITLWLNASGYGPALDYAFQLGH